MRVRDLRSAAVQQEADDYLFLISQRFGMETGAAKLKYPLSTHSSCRAFARSVTRTVTDIRQGRPNSRVKTEELLEAMIETCRHIAYPDHDNQKNDGPIARVLAYELYDRLRAELPPTPEFIEDQVGRILAEASTMEGFDVNAA